MSGTALPVADSSALRGYTLGLLRRHARALGLVLALHASAAAALLAGPWLLGRVVDVVREGGSQGEVDRLVVLIAVAVLAATVLSWRAALASMVLGERVLAQLREDFLAAVVALPLGTVERAGTGDLLARSTSDVETLSRTVRLAVPEVLVSVVTTTLVLVAAALTGPLVALPALVAVPVLSVSTRWYLRRAPAGYLAERASYSTLTAGIAETVDGGRTVDALRLGTRRVARTDSDAAASWRAERYTLFLRTVWFPTVGTAYALPVAAVLLVGGLLHARGLATAGEVTAVTLYMSALVAPLDRLLNWLDELQVGASALARLVGVGQVPPDRSVSGVRPDGEALSARGVRFSYVEGREVLHGVDLDVRPGERLAIVGPSGAGKSTLGRLLAGIHAPSSGSVTVGGAPLTGLPLEELRRHVSLVTQEHHVFVGSVSDNLRLGRPGAGEDELRRALEVVDALGWVRALPDGLDTQLGGEGVALTPAQAQQVALARLVLADPHTLVLDEATSLLDPRAARHLERSLSAVLEGRTVIAIAHRLHTAHDADRVAVVDGGRILELGDHDTLMALDGAYAALWRAWSEEPQQVGG